MFGHACKVGLEGVRRRSVTASIRKDAATTGSRRPARSERRYRTGIVPVHRLVRVTEARRIDGADRKAFREQRHDATPGVPLVARHENRRLVLPLRKNLPCWLESN